MEKEPHRNPREPMYGSLSFWQREVSLPRFSSDLPTQVDIAVIGAGWLGAATCYWLARAGGSVVLLERETLAAGATGRNGGFVSLGPAEDYASSIARLGHETTRTILNVTLDNQALLRRLLDEEEIACDYREMGHLHLALTEEEIRVCVQSRLLLQQDGVATIMLDRDQVQEYIQTPLEPHILAGWLVLQGALVHPVKLVQGVVAAAQRYGAIPVAAEVLHVQADGEGVLLQTSRGTLHVGQVIVATNAWLSELLPRWNELVIPVRGQALAYQPLPPLFVTGMSANLSGTGEYWQQTPDGSIVLGGYRTAAEGNDVGIRSSRPTEAVQNALEQVFPRLFPSLTGRLRVAERWAGSMAFTPDRVPIVDRVPDLPKTWAVGGFSGHGMPYGLRFGQLLAETVLHGTPPSALQPFQLDRPTLKREMKAPDA